MKSVRVSPLLSVVLLAGCHLAIDADRHVGECEDGCEEDAGSDGGMDAGPTDASPPPDAFRRDAPVVEDAGRDGGPVVCGSDLHCMDGVFCNGMERCDPTHPDAGEDGCVPGEEVDCDDGVACTVDECSESAGECTHSAPDGDGDGAGDATCLDSGGAPAGDDCDDGDDAVYPGADELCNGVDDDCDDTVDESADVSVCPAVASGTAGCDEGCVIASCDTDRGDCDGIYSTGCETDTSAAADHCGTCGYVCDDALCHAGECALLADAVAAAANYVCIQRPGGAVWCWGEGYGATRGDLETVALPAAAVHLVSQLHNTCAVLSDGTARCWGRTEISGSEAYFPDAPTAPSSLSNATHVGVGLKHACALRDDGLVACWGNGEGLALGEGYSGLDDLDSPVVIAGVSDVEQIETGWRNNCVRTTAGAVMCWGTMSPSLGDGSSWSTGTPVGVTLPAAAVDIDVTRNHGCAVTTAGEVWCWGRNAEGQLGDGTTAERLSPVRAHAYTDAVDVTVAENITCVERSSGAFECWGINSGRFGDGTYDASAAPVAVDTPIPIDAIDLSLTAAFGVASDGSALSWGNTSTWLILRSTLPLFPDYCVGPGS